jgi:hypothetical protein
VHVAVGHDLVDVAHRRQRDAVPPGDRERLPSCRACAYTPRPARQLPAGRAPEVYTTRLLIDKTVGLAIELIL